MIFMFTFSGLLDISLKFWCIVFEKLGNRYTKNGGKLWWACPILINHELLSDPRRLIDGYKSQCIWIKDLNYVVSVINFCSLSLGQVVHFNFNSS